MTRDDEILSKLEGALSAPDEPRIYALYVNRTAVLLFAADTLSEARQISKEPWLREELQSVMLEGRSLVGPADKIWVVRAFREQERLYRATVGQSAPGSDINLVYLVPLAAKARPDDAA